MCPLGVLRAADLDRRAADGAVSFGGAAAIDRQGKSPRRVDVAERRLLGDIAESVRPDSGDLLVADPHRQGIPGGERAER